MEFDHQQAVSSHAVERYLLGELPSPLREEFEDHFFCCTQCAEALRVASLLRENARALLRAEPRSPAAAPVRVPVSETPVDLRPEPQPGVLSEQSSGWRAWLQPAVLVPWAAVFCLLFFVVKQRSDYWASPVESAAYLNLRTDTRGDAENATPFVRVNTMLSLTVDVPSDGSFEWTLRPAGAQQLRGGTAPHGAGDTQNGMLAVVVDTRKLPPGEYVLAVRPAGSVALPDRLYQFVLQPHH